VAELLHGFALGVRDVPQRGLMVRVTPAMFGGADLEPAEAAELGQALIAQAEEAVHASRARRRANHMDPARCQNIAPGLSRQCTQDEGHEGWHRWDAVIW
jgi:hypothetical protein